MPSPRRSAHGPCPLAHAATAISRPDPRSAPGALVWLGLALVGIVPIFAGCQPAPPAPAAPASAQDTPTGAGPARGGSAEITVFAAASLADAFQEIGAAFSQLHPDLRVTFSFGASNLLRVQLEQGARSDVFASADQAQMDLAQRAGLLASDSVVFAHNRLTLITPRDNPRQIQSLRDLAADGVKLVTAAPSVPVGAYTRAMLEQASADPAYGADFQTRVERNVVSREENVRQVVARVLLGEADAGVVYRSDVTPRVRGQVQQVPLPDALQGLATYPIGVARGANQAGGQAFVQFVLSPPAQAILEKWGFIAARPT